MGFLNTIYCALLKWIKCNVDVAFFGEVGVTTMRASFRDHGGNFVVDLTQTARHHVNGGRRSMSSPACLP
jgi:hypothetical protein